MRAFLLAFFCLCISTLLQAQNVTSTITVKGIAIDSAANQPMPYVTVSLQDVKTHIPVKSGLTADNGSFTLKAPAGAAYQLVLTFISYADKIIPITGKQADINVGKILLSASSKTLKEVQISGTKPLMTREVDRISYNVQADPDSKALSALDMMRKVPLLSVDGNDNIKLKGNGNYKILINGKESAMVAKNPSDVLKSMPATNVEKIEVITTPPAKYDAEGLAGIINIITKKNADQGYSIGVNGRYNSIYGTGYNLNATVKQGKFGMSVYAGLGNNKTLTTTSGNTQNIFAQNTVIAQNGLNTNKGGYKYGSAELSYEIDTLNLLTASIESFGDHNNQSSTQSANTDSAGFSKQGYNMLNAGNSSSIGMDAAINYQMGFKDSKDRLLTFSYKFSYAPSKQFNDNSFNSRLNYPEGEFPDYQQYNNAGDKDHTLQVDYAGPLNKKVTIEAGAKAIFRSNYSNYHQDDKDSTTQQYITNNSQTNDFNYHQDIYSAYNSYELKFDKWTGKAGLRLERTEINADFTSAGVSTAPSYNNLIPSVSIQRSFSKSSINFGFTQRIQRPIISQLNPFVDRTNPLFVSTGNPGLKPELDNTFELNYSNFAKSAINVGLSYAFSNNSIQNVSSLHAEDVNGKKDTVTYTTYQNLGSNRTLGLNLNTNLTITKRFTFNIDAQVSHIWLKGDYNGSEYKNDGNTGQVFTNLRYKFDDGYAISVNTGFFSSNITLQGKSNASVFSQYVASKEFLKKRLTLSLVANNPYTKYQVFRNNTTSADFYQSSFNQNYYRSFALRFNYKFGKLNSEIRKNQHGINNDDTKGGAKNTGGN